MANDFRYKLISAPEGRTDGSGIVRHDIQAQYEQSEDVWVDVPGRHKDFNVPFGEIATVMAMPDSTGPEKQAKNNAYRDVLKNNVDTTPVPISSWDETEMQNLVDANGSAATQATALNEYITVTLSQTYPVEFNL